MHSNNMYQKLVFYLETCESGSMFVNLPDNINIFATTAANAKESSWGTYCHPDDMVDGKAIGSCLGDLYSVNWMENTDAAAEKIWSESLEDQYTLVQKETNRSHVEQFGEMDWNSEAIGDFQGHKNNYTWYPPIPMHSHKDITHVDSRDNYLFFLKT